VNKEGNPAMLGDKAKKASAIYDFLKHRAIAERVEQMVGHSDQNVMKFYRQASLDASRAK
jgi:hypothetical protein